MVRRRHIAGAYEVPSLSQTCQQLYTETVLLLFTENEFTLSPAYDASQYYGSVDVIGGFLSVLSPAQRNAIRLVRIPLESLGSMMEDLGCYWLALGHDLVQGNTDYNRFYPFATLGGLKRVVVEIRGDSHRAGSHVERFRYAMGLSERVEIIVDEVVLD